MWGERSAALCGRTRRWNVRMLLPAAALLVATEPVRAQGALQALERATLVPDAPLAQEWFPFGLGVSGDTVVVGAPFFFGPGNLDGAYVFVRGSTGWEQQARLTAPDGMVEDRFSQEAVAISGDTIVVGARWDDTTGGANAGSAYVFVRNGTTWTLQQKLRAGDGGFSDQFGWSVAVDGDRAVIGAARDGGIRDAPGSAYFFERVGGTWTEVLKLTLPDPG